MQFLILSGGGIAQIIKAYAWAIINAPWFLWATLMSAVFLLVLRVATQDRTWIILISIPIVLLVPDNFNFVWFKFMYPYFVAGYLWNKHNVVTKVKGRFEKQWIKVAVLVALIAVWIYMLQFFRYDFYIYTTHMQIFGSEAPIRQLIIDLFRWAIGFVGSGMVLIAASYINRCKLLQILGKASLGIYLINIYVNLYLLKPMTVGFCPNILINLLETAIVILICYGGTWLLERNKVINRIFLGGR